MTEFWNKKYALLDYDGYVCKALYAAISSGDITDAPRILLELTESAYEKAKKYFYSEDVELIKVMSGHSWKKDKYPTYKAKRKKDPRVGEFREWVFENDEHIFKVEPFEADEILVMMHDYLNMYEIGNCIVFSDDKDLHYVTLLNCKINLAEEIDVRFDENKMFCQMLAGDKEDCVDGINKVGMKTADKLLAEKGAYNLDNVISIYKDKNIEPSECFKQLELINPLKREFVDGYDKLTYDLVAEDLVHCRQPNLIFIDALLKGQSDYLLKEVNKIYAKDN